MSSEPTISVTIADTLQSTKSTDPNASDQPAPAVVPAAPAAAAAAAAASAPVAVPAPSAATAAPGAAPSGKAPSSSPKPAAKKAPPTLRQVFVDLFVGLTAGGIAKLVTANLDATKMFQQVQAVPRSQSWQEVMRTVQRENAGYRAVHLNVLRFLPQQISSLLFSVPIEKQFAVVDAKVDFWGAFWRKLVSGALMGTVANLVCLPLDCWYTRAVAGKERCSGTVTDACLAAVVPTIVGAFTYRLGQLLLFVQIQNLNPYKQDRGVKGAIGSFVAVTAARSLLMPFNYPFDTVRRRLFVNPALSAEDIGSNPAALFDGMLVEWLRGVSGSLVIVAYDRLKVVFNL
jgi:hypothetical protein